MKGESGYWVAVGVAAIGLAAVVASGLTGAAVLILAALGTLMMAAVGSWMQRPVDASWLQTWVTLGFIAKVGGAFARYFMVQFIYGGIGDSLRYYSVGIDLAAIWRQGHIPALTGSGSFGTQVVEAVTGALFAIFTPDLLGGFVIYSMFSFLGQLGLYAAFRRWAEPHQLKPYAFIIFFFPTYAFWPSSIGKDALIIMFLGFCAYSIARLLEGFELRWIAPVALSMVGMGLIRIHIAALVAFGLVGALLVSKVRVGANFMTRSRKFITFAGAAVAVVIAVQLIPQVVGLQLNDFGDVTPFANEITRRTSESGTVASGAPVSSIVDVPGAVALVLFRPYIFEGTELQHLLAAAETTIVLLLFVWKLPAILRNWGRWRTNAYLVFCTLYTLAFAVVFSVVRNLGIIARQRGQVLGLFLAMVIGLGWSESKKAKADRLELEAKNTTDAARQATWV